MGSSHSCIPTSPAAELSRSLKAGDEHLLLKQLAEQPALLSKPTSGGSGSGLGGSLAAQLLPWSAAHHSLTPLHLACESKQIKAVEQMLSFLDSSPLEVVRAALAPYCRRAGLALPDSPAEGVRLAVGMTNCKGQTPLMYACYAGCPELVRLLLERGADPWAGDRCGQRSALHYAAMSGSAACIAALMAHTPPGLLNRPFQPPGTSGASADCRYIDARSLCGLTPLHYAAYFACDPSPASVAAATAATSIAGAAANAAGDGLAALRELLRHDPSLNAASTCESYDVAVTCAAASTPLHMAAVRGNLGAARDILHQHALRSASTTGHWVADPRTRADGARQFPWQVASAYHPSNPKLSALLHPGRSVEAALLWLAEVEEEAAERSRAAREAAQEQAQQMGGRRSIRRRREQQEEQHATVMHQVSRSNAAAAAAATARSTSASGSGVGTGEGGTRVYAQLVLGGVGGIGPAPLAAIAAAALRSRLLLDLQQLEGEEPSADGLPPHRVAEIVEEAEEDEDEDALCGVCFAEPKQVAPSGCGHGLCRGCAAALSRGLAAASGKDGRKPVLCPFCRRGVSGFTAYVPPPAARLQGESGPSCLVMSGAAADEQARA